MTNYAFATWPPCKWTKLGQSLDFGNSKVCPLFVHSHFTLKISIPGWDKFWTNIRHMSHFCPALAIPHRPIAHGPPMAHPRPIPSPLRQTVDKAWTNVGKRLDNISTTIVWEHQYFSPHKKTLISHCCIRHRGKEKSCSVDGEIIFITLLAHCPLPTHCPPSAHPLPILRLLPAYNPLPTSGWAMGDGPKEVGNVWTCVLYFSKICPSQEYCDTLTFSM